MDEDIISWIAASIILIIVTASLTIYQVSQAYILQPTFFFFVFQVSTLVSLVTLFYLLVGRHLSKNRRNE